MRPFSIRDLAIRTIGDPTQYISAVRRCIWSVDSEQAISSVQTLSDLVDDQLSTYKLEAELFSWFTVASLLLSSIGVWLAAFSRFALVGILHSLLFWHSWMGCLVTRGGRQDILLVVLIAAYLPARRASAIDPMAALRGD